MWPQKVGIPHWFCKTNGEKSEESIKNTSPLIDFNKNSKGTDLSCCYILKKIYQDWRKSQLTLVEGTPSNCWLLGKLTHFFLPNPSLCKGNICHIRSSSFGPERGKGTNHQAREKKRRWVRYSQVTRGCIVEDPMEKMTKKIQINMSSAEERGLTTAQGCSVLVAWIYLGNGAELGIPKRKAMLGVQRRKIKLFIFTHNHPVSYEWSLSIFPLGKIKAQIPHSELGFLKELEAGPGLDCISASSLSQLLWHNRPSSRVCRCSLHVGLGHCRSFCLVQQEVCTVCGMLLSYF